ncbi:hypothetical protein [Microcystis phage Mel-JY01]
MKKKQKYIVQYLRSLQDVPIHIKSNCIKYTHSYDKNISVFLHNGKERHNSHTENCSLVRSDIPISEFIQRIAPYIYFKAYSNIKVSTWFYDTRGKRRFGHERYGGSFTIHRIQIDKIILENYGNLMRVSMTISFARCYSPTGTHTFKNYDYDECSFTIPTHSDLLDRIPEYELFCYYNLEIK